MPTKITLHIHKDTDGIDSAIYHGDYMMKRTYHAPACEACDDPIRDEETVWEGMNDGRFIHQRCVTETRKGEE